MHSNFSLSDARPDTPETNSAHSDEKIGQTVSSSVALEIPEQVSKKQILETPPPSPVEDLYLDGPDQIIPTTEVKSWSATGCTRIRYGETKVENRRPISVPSLLFNAARQHGDNVALTVKRDGQWQSHTYAQYYNEVRTMAKSFIKLGLERYHGVCIQGFNSPEWFISDLASIFAG